MDAGRVVWTDYTVHDELGVLVRMGVRMEDGRRRDCYVQGTEPYFFAPSDEDASYGSVVRTEDGYESLFGHDLQKIITEVPRDTGDIEGEFSWSGEADVPYYRRVAIHDGLSGYIALPEEMEELHGRNLVHIDDIDTDIEYDSVIRPRILIGDIEVSIGDETFKETREKASQPINVICAYDTHEEDYSVFFYNKYDSLSDASKIRDVVETQWSGEEDYTDKDIELYLCDSEEELANEFISYVNRREFDLFSGWNFVNFDYMYIIRRFDNLDGVDVNQLSPFYTVGERRNKRMSVVARPAFDMMDTFVKQMTFSNFRSKALDYVANEELGVGKVDDVDINQDWKDNPEKLIGYNVVDVLLTVALDDANDIHMFSYDLGNECRIPIYDTFYEKRIVDGYVMSRRRDDEVLPTAKEEEVPNAGGYVADAVNGRHEKIGVSDLKSLYPSAMITWNISTETISDTPDDFDNYVKVPKVPEPKDVQGNIEKDQIDWDWVYCSLDEEGLLPRTLKELFNKREYEKSQRNQYEPGTVDYRRWDRKQNITKASIMNSFYGNASSEYWRLANEYLGDAVTSAARYTLWKGRVSIENQGYERKYSDTDSHFIELGSDTIEEQVEELEVVSAEMDSHASTIAQDIGIEGEHPYLRDADLHGDEYTCMKWEPEKVYNTWMQLGKKKRYAGDIAWKEGTYYEEPEISISGFEFRRSDSAEVTAELQQSVIKMVLTGAEFEEVSDYIQSVIERIDEEYDDIREFALPGSVNKALHKYPNREVPRACMYSNNHLDHDFGEGSDPFVYYVKDTPSGLPNTDVVALEWNEDLPEGFVLDRESIIERTVRKPIQSIIDELDWKFNEIRSGRQQQTMDLNMDSGNPFA